MKEDENEKTETDIRSDGGGEGTLAQKQVKRKLNA